MNTEEVFRRVTTMGATILLANDHDDEVELLLFILTELGYTVDHACSAEAAWDLFQERGAGAVIARSDLSGSCGIELARRVKQESPSTPVIVLVAGERAKEARSVCDAALAEPVPPILLLETLERLGMGP